MLAAAPAAAREASKTRQAAASVAPVRPTYRAVDRVGVKLDARALRNGSNFRLIVVPEGSPEPIADANEFAQISTPAKASLQRLSLPPGPPGKAEIRLYYIPQFEQRFVIGARAPVEIGPRTPDSTLAYDLTREAKELGPVRFEAKYRDQPFVLEGQFLRVETRTGIDWKKVFKGTYAGPRNYMLLYVGHLGTERPQYGEGPTEVLCLIDAEDKKNVDRAALLNPGDPVLFRGQATTWGRVFEDAAVIFDRCVFAT